MSASTPVAQVVLLQSSNVAGGDVIGVVVAPDGTIYVCDQPLDRIYKLSPDWQVLGVWGGAGIGPGRFNVPHGLALDGAGNLYVADSQNGRVQKLGPDGSVLATILARPVMAAVFRWLEPYAAGLVSRSIMEFADRAQDFHWRKETRFGGLYQMVVAQARRCEFAAGGGMAQSGIVRAT